METTYVEKKALENANYELAEYRMASSKEDIQEGILDLEYLYEQTIRQFNLCMSRKSSSVATFGSNKADALYEITYATSIMKEIISLKKKLLAL